MNRKQPVLSICVPIYNRLVFLERMLSRFSEDKNLFEDDVELIVSDNCSEEDLRECAEKYQKAGLRLNYFRQSSNIGSDGNFKTLFGMATGKYFWLLGSDDIPVNGFLPILVDKLRSADYGLFHINCYSPLEQGKLEKYNGQSAEFVKKISYWITFQSSSIFRTEIIKKVDIPRYEKTWLIQVPVFLTSCCSFPVNAYFSCSCFEAETDNKNNGGYNLFEVFVTNLFKIYDDFINSKQIDRKTFLRIKKDEYRHFLLGYIVTLLIDRKASSFKTEGAVAILWRNYGSCPYAYFYLAKCLLGRWKRNLLNRKPVIR